MAEADPRPSSTLGRLWALLGAVLAGLAAAIAYVAFLPPTEEAPPPDPPPVATPPPAPEPAPAPPPPAEPPPAGLATPEPSAPAGPRVALLIDDIGYSRASRDRLLALPAPIAFAILPEAPQARAAARQLAAAGRDVLAHLPCEPKRASLMAGMRFLTVDLGPAAVTARATEMLDAVPGAVGANNHMGSRFTTEPRVLEPLMRLLRQRGLFFVDSRTVSGSRAAATARQVGVPALARDVFLDDDPSREAVDRQLAEIERRAAKQPVVLAIGHPKPATLDALEHWFANGAGGLTFAAPSELLDPRPQTARQP